MASIAGMSYVHISKGSSSPSEKRMSCDNSCQRTADKRTQFDHVDETQKRSHSWRQQINELPSISPKELQERKDKLSDQLERLRDEIKLIEFWLNFPFSITID